MFWNGLICVYAASADWNFIPGVCQDSRVELSLCSQANPCVGRQEKIETQDNILLSHSHSHTSLLWQTHLYLDGAVCVIFPFLVSVFCPTLDLPISLTPSPLTLFVSMSCVNRFSRTFYIQYIYGLQFYHTLVPFLLSKTNQEIHMQSSFCEN